MNQIEKLIILKRIKLIKKARTIFSLAIREQYMEAIRSVNNVDLQHLTEHIKQVIKSEPIQHAFDLTYSSAANIAVTWRNHLLPDKKDATDELFKTVFGQKLKEYAQTKAGRRITNITGTTKERLEEVVRLAITESVTKGLGIEATKDLIRNTISADYKDFTPQRAQLIAQTEMITASNQAAIEGAKSTGLEFRKFWSTSGMANVRDSHMACEQQSIYQGGLREDEMFVNGLMFPGDPAGSADEVCNCHCTLMTEIV